MENLSEALPASGFVSHLVAMNHLDSLGFDRLVFFPGMLFLALETWWGKNSVRKTAHEGLDVCFFINARQDSYRLDETVRIPVLYQGRIMHIMKDLLGQTIVVRHRADESRHQSFLSFYAHILPDQQLRIGDEIQPGQSLGTIIDPRKVHSPLLPHLHLSLAWESMLPPASGLTWNILNREERSVFIDPLKVLPGPHLMLEGPPDERMIRQFMKCSPEMN